jgi:integrase
LLYANESDELERPIRYRKALASYGETQADEDKRHDSQLTVAEVHQLIEKATETGQDNLVAALWLGVNCGYTTSDLAVLRIDQVDLKGGWVAIPRTKNGNRRLAALWPQTIAAIKKQIKSRPCPAREEHSPLLFLTRHGGPVQRDGNKNRPLTAAFRRLKIAAKVHRTNVSHRSTRHLCRTLADSAGDTNAARLLMGHKIPGVEGRYIDAIDPERVKAVCDHVRKRFIAGKPKKKRTVKKGGAK